MTYGYAWFGALTGWAFCYGIAVGILAPPGLGLALGSLLAARKVAEARDADAAPRRQAGEPTQKVLGPALVPGPLVSQPLPLAA